jgi:hypothetical protein
MVFGAGLMAGLLGEIGHAINSPKLEHISDRMVVVPFDALYEDALHRLTIDTTGFAKFVLELGPSAGRTTPAPRSSSGPRRTSSSSSDCRGGVFRPRPVGRQ